MTNAIFHKFVKVKVDLNQPKFENYFFIVVKTIIHIERKDKYKYDKRINKFVVSKKFSGKFIDGIAKVLIKKRTAPKKKIKALMLFINLFLTDFSWKNNHAIEDKKTAEIIENIPNLINILSNK